MQIFGLAALVSLTSVVVACSGDDSGGTAGGCTPNEQVSCACPGGTQGIQSCASDGSAFGACQCGIGGGVNCGNGVVDAGEQCDDGNNVDDDGCSNSCASSGECGNGVVDAGEDCDDGGAEGGELDTCPSDCQDGSSGSNTGGGGQGGGGQGGAGGGTPDPVCGNGTVEAGEACDDGNSNVGDGCNDGCGVEEGFSCSDASPSVCMPLCGNNVIDVVVNEECDDGNMVNGDGCENTCKITQKIFAGFVKKDGTQNGYSGQSAWPTFNGSGVGRLGGNAMCNSFVGLGSKVCTYAQLVEADSRPTTVENFLAAVPANTTMWLDRQNAVTAGGTTFPPYVVNNVDTYAGGTCNDWKYSTNHFSDGEFVRKDANDVLTYFLDPNLTFDGVNQTGVLNPGQGVQAMTAQTGTLTGTTEAIQCGGAAHVIPCCYTTN
jgi:cysteine-rich repeat protein